MLGIIGDIITIISFVITILTLFTTLGIKRKIEGTVDKHQYVRERDIYIKKLKSYYNQINQNDIVYSSILIILREIYQITEQICSYKLWKKEDLIIFEELKRKTELMLKEIDSYSDIYGFLQDDNLYCKYSYSTIQKMLKNAQNYIIQDTVITEKFKNEYCQILSKVISILVKESKIL